MKPFVDHGLCYRCDHRALFLETDIQPRCECGDVERSVHSCYMYRPVKPVTVSRNKGDSRPLIPGLFSARFHKCAESRVELCMKQEPKGYLIYWAPREKKRGTPNP
jgi:hypothetical protein